MDTEEAEGVGGGGAGEEIGGDGRLCGSGLNAVAGERSEVGQRDLEAVEGEAV